MFDNNSILIFNSALYIITFVIYQKRKKVFTIGSFVLLFYIFVSIVAISLFNSPLANFNDLKLYPFIYLYLGLMVMFLPLLRFNEEGVENLIVCDSLVLKIFSLLIILITIAIFFEQISTISLSSLFNYKVLLQNYDSIHEGLEIMNSKTSSLLLLYYILKDFTIPLLIYNILRKNKGLVWGLSICILLNVFITLSEGARNGLIALIMTVPFVYLVFRRQMSNTLRRKLFVWTFIFSGFIFVGFSAITFARFGQDRTNELLTHSLKNYTSQSFLVFNNYGLDANGIRYGDRTAPIVRKALGLKTSTNYYERRFMYRNMLVDDSYFCTFVGDFTLDYGPVLGFIILALCSLIFKRILKLNDNTYTFSQLFMLYILYRWCVSGFTLWPYAEKIGNMKLVIAFIVYFILRKEEWIYYIKYNKSRISNRKLKSDIL